jgi:hypothetical protein
VKAAVIAAALLLAIGRVWIGATISPQPVRVDSIFKDVAHVFIGGLFVAAWIQRQRWQWVTFWALNAVEVAVAVWSRM